MAREGGRKRDDAELLEAILARLIPTDENGPGAREARVVEYVERTLADADQPLRDAYTLGMRAVDAYARSLHGQGFAALKATQQDAVVSDLELGRIEGCAPSAEAFFELLRGHALEGMFGDPSWGGNAGFAGWKLLGYAGARHEWTHADQQLDAVVSPVWEPSEETGE